MKRSLSEIERLLLAENYPSREAKIAAVERAVAEDRQRKEEYWASVLRQVRDE